MDQSPHVNQKASIGNRVRSMLLRMAIAAFLNLMLLRKKKNDWNNKNIIKIKGNLNYYCLISLIILLIFLYLMIFSIGLLL